MVAVAIWGVRRRRWGLVQGPRAISEDLRHGGSDRKTDSTTASYLCRIYFEGLMCAVRGQKGSCCDLVVEVAARRSVLPFFEVQRLDARQDALN
jgi:hypothetical protein